MYPGPSTPARCRASCHARRPFSGTRTYLPTRMAGSSPRRTSSYTYAGVRPSRLATSGTGRARESSSGAAASVADPDGRGAPRAARAAAARRTSAQRSSGVSCAAFAGSSASASRPTEGRGARFIGAPLGRRRSGFASRRSRLGPPASIRRVASTSRPPPPWSSSSRGPPPAAGSPAWRSPRPLAPPPRGRPARRRPQAWRQKQGCYRRKTSGAGGEVERWFGNGRTDGTLRRLLPLSTSSPPRSTSSPLLSTSAPPGERPKTDSLGGRFGRGVGPPAPLSTGDAEFPARS